MKNWRKFIVGAAFLGLLPLQSPAQVVDIGNSALKKLSGESVAVIDIRRPDEWAETGVVAGSHKLTFFDGVGNYDAKKWLSELRQIVDKTQPLILICRQGVRSKVVGNWLANGLGYSRVYNVGGGIQDWLREGNAVVTD